MPPLLCPSPLLLDHGFPHTPEELRRVAIALGELDAVLAREEARLVLTDALEEFIELFEWEDAADHRLLAEIYRYCALLFVAGGPRCMRLELAEPQPDVVPHPAPADATDGALVDQWRDEVGAISRAHNEVRGPRAAAFVAIACANQFAGEPTPGFEDAPPGEWLDLVGPEGLNDLDDALEWAVPPETAQQKVTFGDAYRNLSSVGCIRIDRPSGGSHYKAHFEGARPWVLDPNADPIPDRFLGELETITGLPTPVVKYALKNGHLPNRRPRVALS
jgi:hypothetical protein